MADLLVWSPTVNGLVRLTPAGVSGGQTELFLDSDDPTRCAALPVSGSWPPEYWEKIEALMAVADPSVAAAFPDEFLLDMRDQTTRVGYAMKRLTGAPLRELVIPAERVRLGLKWGPPELRKVTQQLARLFAEFERLGITQNDAHGGNYLIDWPTTAKGPRVSRVDALAFGFHWQGKYFGTDAAVYEFLPTELQSVDLSTVQFTREADRYALACLMFALLTDGGYPWNFAGGHGTPAERVARKEFAVFSNPKGTKVPPVVESAVKALPLPVVVLFKRAFLGEPDKRPSPKEWCDALAHVGKKARPVRRDQKRPWFDWLEAALRPLRGVLRPVRANRWMLLTLACGVVATVGVPSVKNLLPARAAKPATVEPWSAPPSEPPITTQPTQPTTVVAASPVAAEPPAATPDDDTPAEVPIPSPSRQPRDRNSWENLAPKRRP